MMNARLGEQEAYRISHKSNEESGKNISWFWFNCRHFYDQFALNVDKNFLSYDFDDDIHLKRLIKFIQPSNILKLWTKKEKE